MVIIVINYFWGKPLPSPKPSNFFIKYKDIMIKVGDTGIIFFILLFVFLMVIPPIRNFFRPLPYSQEILPTVQKTELSLLFLNLIPCSGFLAFLAGLLSIFQKNITKFKRLFLFIICLIPVFLTILTCFIISKSLNETEEIQKETVKLGLIYSVLAWFINGTAIISGKSFTQVWWYIMCKLRIASGECPE